MSTTFNDYLGMLLFIDDHKSVVIPVFGVKTGKLYEYNALRMEL
jgi:hypothetical protein